MTPSPPGQKPDPDEAARIALVKRAIDGYFAPAFIEMNRTPNRRTRRASAARAKAAKKAKARA